MVKDKKAVGSDKGSIVIYHDKSSKAELEVQLEKDTVWLSQIQMANLFKKDVRTVSEHINNVYKEGELPRKSTIRKFRIVQTEGNRQIARKIDFYNLDVIISVGYRVKSQQGTKFRIWATKVLRNYLTKGYALNQKRLLEQQQKFDELKQAIAFIQEKVSYPQLEGQAKELLNIINKYSRSLSLLYQYDKKGLQLYKGQKPKFVLSYEEAIKLIDEIKIQLSEKGESSTLLGQEYGDKFRSVIGVIYQTFDRKDLYVSIDEKAANLLYLVIKDHPFADGNKRIASILFLYFLEKNSYLLNNLEQNKISNNTMVVLALLIAESHPDEKEVMIKIVTNLLKN